jgi:nucleoside-diphosphate-sugar epimerase
MTTSLITGAAGFIGSVLARRCVEEGHEVHLLVRPESTRWRIENLSTELHEASVTDAATVTAIVGSVRPDWIFHLAAYGGSEAQSDTKRMVDVNVHGTMNVLRAGLETGFRAFVNAGSSSEYGYVEHPPDEDELPRPNSDYAVTKAAATMYCRSIAERREAPVSTLRLYSAYGPYEAPGRFIPTLVLDGLEGRLPRLVSPKVARDFVFIDDVVDAFLRAARAGASGSVYNVGTGRQITIEDAVRIARRALDVTAEPSWGSMPDRQWDTTTWFANAARIRAELGWAPRTTFEDGLQKTVEWFRSSPKMQGLYRSRA